MLLSPPCLIIAPSDDQRQASFTERLPSNRGFAEWGEVFGDPVVATALLDRLLHHAVVIQIEGASYRLRQHADLIPEHLRFKPLINPSFPAIIPGSRSRRRGRRPKLQSLDQPAG